MPSKKKPRNVITPYTITEDKKDYKEEGECIIYNELEKENIKTLEEIQQMSFEEGKDYLEKLREKYSVRELTEIFNTSNYYMYNKLLKPFGLVKTSPKTTQKPQKADEIKDKKRSNFTISLEGDFEGESLQSRLISLVDILEAEQDYEIYLTIEEKTE